jgi:hypothetical protein
MDSALIASQYLIMWLVASVIGAISVAAVDATRHERGRPVPQH